MVQTPEQEVERWARYQRRYQRQLWRSPSSHVFHLPLGLLSLLRATHLIGRYARLASLDAPRLVELDVPVAGLPLALAGLRIGHISDLHIGPLFLPEQAQRGLALLRGAAPDLIVMTGDLVDDRPRDTVPAAQIMGSLTAPLGAYGVLGNHDHKVMSARLLAALSEHAPNLHMLVNAATCIRVGTQELWIAGLDSAYLGLADPVQAFASVPDDAPCLLLMHEPDAADHLQRPVTLALAGHAHAGQVRWRGKPVLLPPLGRRYPGGLHQSTIGPIHTSPGIGWTALPLRLSCPPEVTVLRLVHAARAG